MTSPNNNCGNCWVYSQWSEAQQAIDESAAGYASIVSDLDDGVVEIRDNIGLQEEIIKDNTPEGSLARGIHLLNLDLWKAALELEFGPRRAIVEQIARVLSTSRQDADDASAECSDATYHRVKQYPPGSWLGLIDCPRIGAQDSALDEQSRLRHDYKELRR